MGAISKIILDGIETTPPREFQELQIHATFDNDDTQANINFSTVSLVNDANEIVKNWFNGNIGITEGMPVQFTVSDGVTYTPLEGSLNWSTYQPKSSVECEIGILKEDSLNGFFDRAKGITMLLLQELDFNTPGSMPTTMGVNIPYIIKNRKTELEKLELIGVAFVTIKSFIDEIFKFIAIASDITSAGVIQALVNFAVTSLNLVILTQRLVNQLLSIQQSLFPFVRYHRGINIKTFLERGCDYMGYTLDVGSFGAFLENVNLCPHKTDEEGLPVGFLGGGLNVFNNQVSGILKPSDFGYVLSDSFELVNRLAHTKIAIIGTTVKLLPRNDAFWTLAPTYTLPNILIEQTESYNNGTPSYNIDELVGRTVIEYATDDSDLWTLTNVNDSISETIVTPLSINNQKNVQIRGLDNIQIPYALCDRNVTQDELYDLFIELVDLNDFWTEKLKEKFDEFSDILEGALPELQQFLLPISLRDGAMRVENHFFSTPKIVWMEDGKIPIDYVGKIGAIALYNNYHSYKSFVQGVKNPLVPSETNQKKVFRDVTIPFGMSSFNQIINNSYFTDVNGKIGKFTSVKWGTESDTAIVDYYIFENYNNNLQETTT